LTSKEWNWAKIGIGDFDRDSKHTHQWTAGALSESQKLIKKSGNSVFGLPDFLYFSQFFTTMIFSLFQRQL
jgi:hypothetical protein